MAKRRRLTLQDGAAERPRAAGIETKAWLAPGPGLAPPIARVAGEAAASAALREGSEAMAAVRAEGRLVARLALEAIADDHLLRDRLEADAEGLAALVASIRAHGQR
ncbi:MAG: nuclease, partial [Gemmobacter sp.]